MLVLRRKPGESIVLSGGRVIISVLAVEGERVKIGINAPPDVSIVREELLDTPGRQETMPSTKVLSPPGRRIL